MKKKIVILYSTSGHGHMNSAKAIMQALEKKDKDVEIKFVNILSHGNNFFNFLHFNFYVTLMKYAKWLWGFIYYISDLPGVSFFVRAMRHLADHKSWKGLEELLEKEKPDAIVSTHFFLTSIARAIRGNKNIHAKLYLMVSGYGMHNIWFSKHVNHYFTGIQSVSDELIKRGVTPHRVTVTGMPAPAEFSEQYDIERLYDKFGIDRSKKTVFILSGAYGASPMESILEALDKCRSEMQVIVVCGYNERARKNIEVMRNKLKYPIILFGFTEEIAELMVVSDLMISKAGTLSVAQALTMNLPMILFSHVPGHETPTVDLLVKEGAAKRARNIRDIAKLTDEILVNDEVYEKMKEGIGRISHKDSAGNIADIILKGIGVR